MQRELPLIRELPDHWTPHVCFARLKHLPMPMMLESVSVRSALGRYTFIAVDPVARFVDWGIEYSHGSRELNWLPIPRQWSQWHSENPELPPFQGGLAGLLSYELGHQFEVLPRAPFRPMALPQQSWGLYDVVLAWDHLVGRGWLISQGLPETDVGRRKQRAGDRLQFFWRILESSSSPPSDREAKYIDSTPARLAFAPQFDCTEAAGVTSNFTRAGYLAAVDRARSYITAGDIFQVNLSHQLLAPQTCTSWQLYQQLCHDNPATFAGYFDLGRTQIISASPERLLCCQDGLLETRPIKGTRQRTGDPQVDAARTAELLGNRKDRAENIMIVDLMRNDLSRVCCDDSVTVTQLCAAEAYETVIHLVSAVTGKLRTDRGPSDWLAAVFPGGSVTGAPKIRSMEIITELEQSARGAYCGSLGYLSVTGHADFNLLIRTITAQSGWWQFPVGGAIVSDSDPQAEWEETWTKAAGLLRAIHHQNQRARTNHDRTPD